MTPLRVTGEAADEIRQLVPDVETLAHRLAAVDYLVDEGLATSMFLSLRAAPAAVAGGRGRGRQDRGRQVARGGPGHAADPPAVLRGDRRGRGAVRVELSPPAAQRSGSPTRRAASCARRICSAPTT